jgi:twitching motility protein PilT
VPLSEFVAIAVANRASDLHLEGDLPMALRVDGELRRAGDPVPADRLISIARDLLGNESWQRFLRRRSFDLSRTLHGTRCRINVFKTSRGVGLAIRLLPATEPSIQGLNLHPDLAKIAAESHGLVLVAGATGSGKSSTMAALIEEINQSHSRHIVTIESPIEYVFQPRRGYVRQREVGYDTPSFAQALLDVTREDPDVIMVGELRDAETMRLTLNAAETGRLVFGTIHAATSSEALARLVSAFPSESQAGVASQLADCLTAVVCQRLRQRRDIGIRVPECEILRASHAVRNIVRTGQFHKLAQLLDTGGGEGMWSFARYQEWLRQRKDFVLPAAAAGVPPAETVPQPRVLEPPAPAPASEVVDIGGAQESVDEILSELDLFRRE